MNESDDWRVPYGWNESYHLRASGKMNESPLVRVPRYWNEPVCVMSNRVRE